MKLDGLEVELRTRSAWEGVDLGLAMLRRWWLGVVVGWGVSFGPLALALFIVPEGARWFALLVLWWLKPLFERVVVYVLSRAMFGAPPNALEVLRALPATFGTGLLRTLTWRRLVPDRALTTSVDLLEGLRGSQRHRRERNLASGAFGVISTVCLSGWLFERAIEAALLGLLVFATPAELLPELAPFFAGQWERFDPRWLIDAALMAHVVGYSAGAIVHAAAGFGLYLQRRTELEGWDIEVAFRRLGSRVARVRSARSGVASTLRAGALLTVFIALGAARAHAQADASTDDARDPATVIARVLDDPDFATKTRDLELNFDCPELDAPGRAPGLSGVLEVIAWGSAIALALALVYAIVLALSRARFERTAKPAPPPTHVFGLDVRPQSLPDDVPAAALAAWRSGDARAALALLYRASIALLARDDGLELTLSDTESDCLLRARRSAPAPRAEFFARVTGAWLVCAYARTQPSESVFEALCSDWRTHFVRGGAR